MLVYFLLFCIAVAVVHWLVRINIEPSKEQQRTPSTIQASSSDRGPLTAEQASHTQSPNDHPILLKREQQRPPITIKASTSDGSPLTAEQTAHFQSLNDHPVFVAIKPMLANGDWNGARLFLQKCAYGIKQQSAEEQQNFKEIMTAFASSDPLYQQCMKHILPMVTVNPGIKQTDLYPHMAAAPDIEHCRYVLYFAHELGHISRLKKGNSYLIYPVPNADEKPTNPVQESGNVAEVSTSTTYAYGAQRMNDAYWEVMAELEGEGLSKEVLVSMQHEFLSTNDRYKAAKLLCNVLADVQWHWPRWYKQLRSVDFELHISPFPREEILLRASKSDLMDIANKVAVTLKPSQTRKVMAGKLLQTPLDALDAILKPYGDDMYRKRLLKMRQPMAEFVFSRVHAVAGGNHRFEQLTHPDSVVGMPYWRFICQEYPMDAPPAKCRKLNGTVLPVAQAMKSFPRFPCDRIICHCRVTGQRTATEHIGRGS